MAIDIDDENGLREKYDQIGMSQIETVRSAQAQKAAMDTLGINWSQQQSAEILKTMAANPGNIAGQVGAGIGMGAASANAFGAMASQMLNNGVASVSSNNESSDDSMEKLTKLKKMLDAGLIEQADYDKKKSEILANM